MSAQLLQLVTIGPWELNSFDVGVLAILLVSALYAASRGLLREVISILSLLFAVIISLFVWGQFRFTAQEYIKPAQFADGVLAVGTFLITYLLLALIMSKIGKTIAGKDVGFLDRILGAGFGIARGLIVAALVTMVFTSGNRADAEAKETKQVLIERGVYDDVKDTLPKSFQDQMEADTKPLAPMFANSTFYPLLERIGEALRSLPFAKVKTYAERIKDGDLSGITDDLLESNQ